MARPAGGVRLRGSPCPEGQPPPGGRPVRRRRLVVVDFLVLSTWPYPVYRLCGVVVERGRLLPPAVQNLTAEVCREGYGKVGEAVSTSETYPDYMYMLCMVKWYPSGQFCRLLMAADGQARSVVAYRSGV